MTSRFRVGTDRRRIKEGVYEKKKAVTFGRIKDMAMIFFIVIIGGCFITCSEELFPVLQV